ncbi:MAG: hypothetical protein HC888_10190 [Candidatus Competibacteraceae bacterium]|nr:hypothetical protein [Candidatus Competibacteraceae bacterium]
MERTIDPYDLDSIPTASKIGGTLLLAGFFLFITGMRIAILRIIDETLAEGQPPSPRRAMILADQALGNMNYLATLVVAIFYYPLLAAFVFAGWEVALRLEAFGTSPAIAYGLAATAMFAVYTVVIRVPGQWVLPLLAREDCGWMRAIEASTRLVSLERRRAFGLHLLSSLLAATIVGLPAACALSYIALRSL